MKSLSDSEDDLESGDEQVTSLMVDNICFDDFNSFFENIKEGQ